jgi:hypothetical protein
MRSKKLFFLCLRGLLLSVALTIPLTCRSENAFDSGTSVSKAEAATFKELKHYDWRVRTREGKNWPPYIPGTEGQKEVKVQVLDATTMKPVEGAIVVAGYYGWRGRDGDLLCANAESAITDAEGWATLPNDQDERVHGPEPKLFGPFLESAYKRGYRKLSYPLFRTYSRKVEGRGDGEYWILSRLDVNITFDERLHNSLYIYEKYIDQPEKYPDEKSALMASKNRSTIYLYPSLEKAKERAEELKWIDGGSCKFRMPFAFSTSEGPLAARRAVYQEMLDIGYTKEELSYGKAMLDNAEKSYQEFRQRTATKKAQ